MKEKIVTERCLSKLWNRYCQKNVNIWSLNKSMSDQLRWAVSTLKCGESMQAKVETKNYMSKKTCPNIHNTLQWKDDNTSVRYSTYVLTLFSITSMLLLLPYFFNVIIIRISAFRSSDIMCISISKSHILFCIITCQRRIDTFLIHFQKWKSCYVLDASILKIAFVIKIPDALCRTSDIIKCVF